MLTTENDMFMMKRMPFSIELEGIELKPRRGKGLDITVSVRDGERLDPPEAPLVYSDPLLAGESRFAIIGLTLEELSAEKILGWVSREHIRHYIDLAYVARGFDDTDRDKTCELVAAKFTTEKDSLLYRDKGITTIFDLVAAFSSERALATLRRGWDETLGTGSSSCQRNATCPLKRRWPTWTTSSATSTTSGCLPSRRWLVDRGG